MEIERRRFVQWIAAVTATGGTILVGDRSTRRKPKEAAASSIPEAEIEALRAQIEALQGEVDQHRILMPQLLHASGLSPEAPMTPDQIVAGIEIYGVPQRATNVLVASGEFENQVGRGTEMAFAESGGLLVGPDFEDWSVMHESGGSIRPFNPLNQGVIRDRIGYQRVPADGFAFFTLNGGRIEIGDYRPENQSFNRTHAGFNLPYEDGLINFVVVRGLYRPVEQDQGGNLLARVTEHIPGNVQTREYGARDETNLAFISLGQLEQELGLDPDQPAHMGGGDCGPGGCSRALITMYDANTGGVAIAEHTNSFKELYRNF